jgi:hypothetical protein
MRNTAQYDTIIANANAYLLNRSAEMKVSKKKVPGYDAFQLTAIIGALTGVDKEDVLADIMAMRE